MFEEMNRLLRKAFGTCESRELEMPPEETCEKITVVDDSLLYSIHVDVEPDLAGLDEPTRIMQLSELRPYVDACKVLPRGR